MPVSQTITVTGSRTTSGPGVYYVTTPGVTITLETWSHWPDASATITVKDMTGSDTPNIRINAPAVVGGAVDGAASATIVNNGQGLVFRPYLGGNTYGVTG